MIHYREGSAADRDAILGLRRICFAHEDLDKQDPRYWDWEFANGRVFLAESDGRPVAHIGFIPREMVIAGESVRAALAVDAMTHPGFRRQGIFRRLMNVARDAIAQEFRISIAWQIRKAVLPAMTENGWHPALSAPVLAKILFRTAAATPPFSNTTTPPRNLYPHGDYQILETAHARLVTRRTTLKGFDTVAILDAAWSDVAELRQLLRYACAKGKEDGATLAAALITLRHPLLPILLRAGFLPTPHRFRLLVNLFDATLRAAVRRNRWALLWADTDHL